MNDMSSTPVLFLIPKGCDYIWISSTESPLDYGLHSFEFTLLHFLALSLDGTTGCNLTYRPARLARRFSAKPSEVKRAISKLEKKRLIAVDRQGDEFHLTIRCAKVLEGQSPNS